MKTGLLARASGEPLEGFLHCTVTEMTLGKNVSDERTIMQIGVHDHHDPALQNFDETVTPTEDLVSCLGYFHHTTMEVHGVVHTNIEINMNTLMEPFTKILTRERLRIPSKSFVSIFLNRSQPHVPFATRAH